MWTTAANRAETWNASVMGWTANAHIVGQDFHKRTVRDVIAQTRQRVLGMIEHQEIPAVFLRQVLSADAALHPVVHRDPNDMVWFAQRTIGPVRQCGDVTVERTFDYGTVRRTRALGLVCDVSPSAISLAAYYVAERFESGAVQALLNGISLLLPIIIERPDTPVSALANMLAAERCT